MFMLPNKLPVPSCSEHEPVPVGSAISHFGASLSEPHTSVIAFAEVVVCLLCGHIP